uniref:Uncharacterized protein n=1 Tax=Oryza meridionalis TaxID=40149 RepID=A0A0E0F6W7_9ORYZ
MIQARWCAEGRRWPGTSVASKRTASGDAEGCGGEMIQARWCAEGRRWPGDPGTVAASRRKARRKGTAARGSRAPGAVACRRMVVAR